MIKIKLFFIFSLILLFAFTAFSTEKYKVIKKETKEKNKKYNYELNVRYPKLENVSDPNSNNLYTNFNNYVKDVVDKEVKNFKKDIKTWESPMKDMPSSYEIYDTIIFNDDDLISVRLDGYYFYSGSAHPGTFFLAVNYDLKNDKIIVLKDIFSGDYLKIISELCISEIIKQQKEYIEDYIDSSWVISGAGPVEENFKVFNFTKTYFQITFPAYQVASYAEGPKDVVINYGKLLKVIKTDGALGKLVNE
jgi:hypothetical protein